MDAGRRRRLERLLAALTAWGWITPRQAGWIRGMRGAWEGAIPLAIAAMMAPRILASLAGASQDRQKETR